MILLLALSACSPDYEPDAAEVALCLGVDREDLVWDYDNHQVELEGELVGLEVVGEDESFDELNLVGCYGPVDLLLSVKVVQPSMEEAVWTVGIGLAMESGSITPGLDLELGQSVVLDYQSVVSFGDSQAVVIQDAGGVVFAADQAQWGDALGTEPLEGLTLSRGEERGQVDGDCGIQSWSERVFETSAGEVALDSGETGQIELHGQSLTALNARSVHYIESNCTDLADQESWAIWR